MGKGFLNLVNKHFPPHHKFRKLFNKNTIKVSYSCIPSMKSKINSHNRHVLGSSSNIQACNARLCNCPEAGNCPLNGNCLQNEILYLGRITSYLINYKPKEYKGICSTVFKERYRNHNKAFNNERYRMDTELSKEVWAVKNKNGTPKISWSIFGRFPPYNLESKRCYLCLNEKLEIAIHKEDNLLNR